MSRLVFSHANSFPAGTYRRLLSELERAGHPSVALERIGHDPRFPVSNNWPALVRELATFIEDSGSAADGPPWLVGHSLGGFLSLMTAALHPGLARGVVLLDAPVIAGWKALVLGLVKRTPLAQALGPGRVSARRRQSWPDRDAVLRHFRGRGVFTHWDPEVLADYVDHGTRPAPESPTTPATGRVLHFDRDIETRIYNSLPSHLPGLLRRHPLQCGVAFIGGTQSAEVQRVGMEATRRLTHNRVQWVPGSHLFPMEQPLATAAAIVQALGQLQQTPQPEPGFSRRTSSPSQSAT